MAWDNKIKNHNLKIFYLLFLIFDFLLASPLENIPTNSWIYEYIDYLKTQGLIKTVPLGIKPWPRKEAAGLVKEALNAARDQVNLSLPTRTFLSRLRTEFSLELKELRHKVIKEQRRRPLLRIPFSEDFVNFDLFHRIRADTNNQTGSLGTMLSLGKSEKFAAYERIEFTLYRETIPDIRDSSGTHVPLTRVHSWMNIATLIIDQAYLVFKIPYFSLLLGRDNLYFGPGFWSSVILSDFAPSLDMIQLKATHNRVRFLTFTAALSRWGLKNRFLSGQRLELVIFEKKNLSSLFGTTMFVVHSPDGFETKSFFGLINPLIPLYFEEANSGHDDNLLVGFDLSLYLPKVKLYGALLIDNYEFIKKPDPPGNFYAWQLGFHFTPPSFFDLRSEYARIIKYTYYHRVLHSAFTNYDVQLGHRIGPDADELRFRLGSYFSKKFNFYLQTILRRSGAGNRGGPIEKTWFNNQETPVPKEFPSGTVETSLSFGPELLLWLFRDLRITTGIHWTEIKNFGGICGKEIKGIYGFFKLEFRYN